MTRKGSRRILAVNATDGPRSSRDQWPSEPIRRRMMATSTCTRDATTIWRIPLASLDPGQEAILSAAERARAHRFRFARHQARYIVAHSAMRTILAQAVDSSPEDISYLLGRRGKPRLAEPSASGLEFNLTYSGDLALLALSWGRPVGVDLERRREIPGCTALAEQYFAPSEATAVMARPMASRSASFLSIWTCKEAWLKATGDGLSRRLDSFVVGAAPGEPHLIPNSAEADPRDWWVGLLDISPDHIAALAVEGRRRPVVQRWWGPPPPGVPARRGGETRWTRPSTRWL